MERKIDIDIAKGIGILMVVWAHANGPFTRFIDSFHMPFFFFISGVLYKGYKSIGLYTKGKVRSLLLPFWIYNLMLYPVFFVLFYWGHWNYRVLLKELIEIIICVNKVPFLGATWFLPALFWVSVSFHIIYRLFYKFGINDVFLLPLGFMVMIVGVQITFPYRISRTLICACFYVMGYFFNKYLKESSNKIIGGLIAVVMFAGSVYFELQFPGSIVSNTYTNKITFFIGAAFATYSFIYVAELMAQTNVNGIVAVLSYLGKNSMHIVIWQFLAFRFVIVLQILIDGAPLSSITAFPVYDSSGLWFPLYLFTGIVFSLIIGKVMDKCILERIRSLYCALHKGKE